MDQGASQRVDSIRLLGTNKVGVLLLHGWTATPQEVQSTAWALHERGYTILAPVLRGHGTCAEDLRNVKLEDWISDASASLQDLKQRCDQIVVGGLSMGSNLALILAAREDVSAVVVVSPVLWVRLHWAVRLMSSLTRRSRRLRSKRYRARDIEAASSKVQYSAYPSSSLHEFLRSSALARITVSQTTGSMIVIRSRRDAVAGTRSVRYLRAHRALGFEVVTLPWGYHSLTVDEAAPRVNRMVGQFLDLATASG